MKNTIHVGNHKMSTHQMLAFCGRLALGGAVLLADVLPLQAETVVWYRLEEFGTGETASVGSYLENAVNPGSMRAVVQALGTGAAVCPTGVTHAVGNPYSSADPVQGLTLENGNALSFPHKGATAPVLKISDDVALQSKTMTVEFFIRALDLGAGLENVITKDAGGNFGWSVRTHPNGYVMLYFYKGDGQYFTTSARPTGFNLGDAKWHHCAFSLDGQTKELKVYLDYDLCVTTTLDFSLDWFSNGDVYIGNFSNGNYPFVGELDDIRISNVVLGPGQMLRTKRISALAGSDTAAYLSFDEPGDSNWSLLCAVCNEAGARQNFLPKIVTANKAPFVQDSPAVLPHQVTYDGIFPTASKNNAYALHLAGDETHKGASSFTLSDEGRTLPMDSFTFEMFFQDNEPNADGTDKYFVHVRQVEPAGTPVWMLRRTEDGRFVLQYGSAWTSMTSGVVPFDATWHHEAVVYDKTSRTLSFYLDYELKMQMTEVELATELADGNGEIRIGSYQNAYNCSDSRFDELRITKRALKPEEFLTPYAVQGKTLAWYGFEGDWGVRQTMPLAKPGTASAFVAGGTAQLGTRPASKDVVDAVGNLARTPNMAFADVANGKVVHQFNPYVVTNDITVEAFLNVVADPSADACAFGFGPTQYTKIWAIGFGANRQLRLRLRMAEGDNNFKFVDYPDALPRGWQHVAFSLKAVGGTSTEVKLYADYQLVKTETLAGLVMDPVDNVIGNSVLKIGESWLSAPGFVGKVDELRISMGQLEPDEFLRFRKGGTILIFR